MTPVISPESREESHMTRPTVTSTIPRSIEDIDAASLTEAMRGTGTLHYSPTTSKVAT